MLYQIVYTSSATQKMTPEDLAVLLEEARERNTRLGVTGMLLYNDGNFLQVIEGEKEDLAGLYDMIRSDDRHTGVITLMDRPLERRDFDDWTMGFRRLDTLKPEELEGYTDFMGEGSGAELDVEAGHAYEALLHFRDMDSSSQL